MPLSVAIGPTASDASSAMYLLTGTYVSYHRPQNIGKLVDPLTNVFPRVGTLDNRR